MRASASNSQGEAARLGNPRWGASVVHDVPGLIVVGATTLGDPTVLGDEEIADFSSDGDVTVAAPGVDHPIGPPDRNGRPTSKDWSGTSFSSPYVSGVIALMLQANPDLSTDEIRDVLRSTAVPIPGGRSGAGVVDGPAAVREARRRRR